MKRYKNFDYTKRSSLHAYYGNSPDCIEGYVIAFHETIYSVEGAWYHCWIPRGLTKGQENHVKQMFRRRAYHKGDPVKFTWDYEPEKLVANGN